MSALIFEQCKENLRQKYKDFSNLYWKDFDAIQFGGIDPLIKSPSETNWEKNTIKFKDNYTDDQIKLLLTHELLHVLHGYKNLVIKFRWHVIINGGALNALHDILIDNQIKILHPEIPKSVWVSLNKATGRYKQFENCGIQAYIDSYIKYYKIDTDIVDLTGHFSTLTEYLKEKLMEAFPAYR